MFASDTTGTSLRAVINCPNGGQCMMAGFPGLETGLDGTPYIDPEPLGLTLDAIAAQGAQLLVVLTEEPELPDGSYLFLQNAAKDRNIDLAFLPIPDFQTPDEATLALWHDLERSRDDMPGNGGTIAFCCQHGAGRSGLMATYVLIRQSTDLDTAVKTVRDGFSEAIESDAQMAWLRMVSTRLKDDSATLDLE